MAGYGLATVVGLARMDNNRHWTSDVLVGGGIGMLLGQCLYALHFDERGVFRRSQWQVNTFDDGDASGLVLTYHF
jgi:membrane-associated phospholipid phosphatase